MLNSQKWILDWNSEKKNNKKVSLALIMLNILYTTLLPNFILFSQNLYFSISVENSVDADKKPADQDLSCFFLKKDSTEDELILRSAGQG